MFRSHGIRMPFLLALATIPPVGCSQQKAPTTAPALSAVELADLADEVRAERLPADETVAAAKAHGFDYAEILTRCLARDPAAMHDLFRMHAEAGFHDEMRADYEDTLGLVLRDAGERFFTRGLAAESAPVQRAIRDRIAAAFDWETQAEFDNLRQLYPKLFPEGYQPPDYANAPPDSEDDPPTDPNDEPNAPEQIAAAV